MKRQPALTPKDIIAMRDSMAERSPASGHKRSFSEYEHDLRRDHDSGHAGRKVDRSTTQSPAHAASEALPPVRTQDSAYRLSLRSLMALTMFSPRL